MLRSCFLSGFVQFRSAVLEEKSRPIRSQGGHLIFYWTAMACKTLQYSIIWICVCDISICVCNIWICVCNISICVCNIWICVCNISICVCNISICVCNISICVCNISICVCNISYVLQLCTARSERFGCRLGRKLSGVFSLQTYTHHVHTTLERGKDESRHRWAFVYWQIKRFPDRNWRVSLLFFWY